MSFVVQSFAVPFCLVAYGLFPGPPCMIHFMRILSLSLILLLCAPLTLSQNKDKAKVPSEPRGFSADIRGVQDGAPITGQLYFTPDKLRMEQNAGGTKTILILDRKQKLMWILNTSEKIYGEVVLTDPAANINMPFPDETGKPCVPMNATSCTLAARETVNDRQCDRWEVSAPDNGKTVKTTIWIDPVLGAPIQWKNDTGDHYELTNIKIGMQLDSLFQVPAGYEKK